MYENVINNNDNYNNGKYNNNHNNDKNKGLISFIFSSVCMLLVILLITYLSIKLYKIQNNYNYLLRDEYFPFFDFILPLCGCCLVIFLIVGTVSSIIAIIRTKYYGLRKIFSIIEAVCYFCIIILLAMFMFIVYLST